MPRLQATSLAVALVLPQATRALKNFLVQAPRGYEPQPAFRGLPSKYCQDHVPNQNLSDFDQSMEVAEWCKQCYVETMKTVYGGSGSDIIMGANDGKTYDPAYWLEYWSQVPKHTKVLVEPVPPIFKKLEQTSKNWGNVIALNTAVRSDQQPQNLTLFCWDLDMVDSAVKHGASPLPPEVKQPREYWSYLCGTDRKHLIESSDVLSTQEYASLSREAKLDADSKVDRYIKEYTVPALTPREIVAKAGPRDVRYVQIDVEGLDNQIVGDLPFGEEGFWPEVVLYENHEGHLARPRLESNGYYVCCCFNKWGNNMLAVRNHPAAHH